MLSPRDHGKDHGRAGALFDPCESPGGRGSVFQDTGIRSDAGELILPGSQVRSKRSVPRWVFVAHTRPSAMRHISTPPCSRGCEMDDDGHLISFRRSSDTVPKYQTVHR
jgi:hypothetical protein